MNREQYQYARRLIRANGYYALRWLRMSHASIMLQLKNQREDQLKYRQTYFEQDWMRTVWK